jgi:hypothetical protein
MRSINDATHDGTVGEGMGTNLLRISDLLKTETYFKPCVTSLTQEKNPSTLAALVVLKR